MSTGDRPKQKHGKAIFGPLQEPDEIRVLKLNSGTTPAQIDCELIVTRLASERSDQASASFTFNSNTKNRKQVSKTPNSVTNTPLSRKYVDKETQTVDRPARISFEALSWCWGRDESETTINIKKDGKSHEFQVSHHLREALEGLRRSKEDRFLWVDAICINQDSIEERNAQVPKMDRIYGSATNVCVWIGAADQDSDRAIDFIEEILLKLWEFDDLCRDKLQSKSWAALINLMRREWFSRRWVVQEIALAQKASLHCGKKEIDWQKFADAVSLFVHVESATHILSDVMKTDELFHNFPDYFGDISALGAALLVEATRNLFRKTQDGKRHTQHTLEYLISKYSVFESAQPRDTIYAFLAIAKDTKAQSSQESVSSWDEDRKKIQAGFKELPPRPRKALSRALQAGSLIESFKVDYGLPVEVVYKDFIAFSIERSMKTDPRRPLDIICRPWAPPVRPGDAKAGLAYMTGSGVAKFYQKTSSKEDTPKPLPSWIPSRDHAPFAIVETRYRGSHMERRNADSLTGLPTVGEQYYSAGGTRPFPHDKLVFKTRRSYLSMSVDGFIFDEIGTLAEVSNVGNVPLSWPRFAGWQSKSEDLPEDFWRTLVADRGPNSANPPTFYSRACKEALEVIFQGIPLQTKQVIDQGRCTIIAEFLRRVQTVIWNRALMRTKREPHQLGLVPSSSKEGDLICILFGCSVPVILRKVMKTREQKLEDFDADDEDAAIMIQRNWRRSVERKREAADKGKAPESGSRSRESEGSQPKNTGSQGAELKDEEPEGAESEGAQPKSDEPPGLDQNDKKPEDTEAESSKSRPPRPPKPGHLSSSSTSPSSASPPPSVPPPPERPSVPKIFTITDYERERERLISADQFYYVLIGESYVHRIMDGEAVDWQIAAMKDENETNKPETISFTLR
jgi:hypothetical protein